MGIITIAFDDGYKDMFEHCIDFLTENNIPATFAVAPSTIGKTLENRTVINAKDLLFLKDNGHEIASHTLSHKNLLETLDLEGEKSVRHEMKGSKIALEKTLGTNIESMVFPFIENNYNGFLLNMASEYYSSSRITTEKAAFNKLPVKDPFSIRGVAFTQDIEIRHYNKLVDMVTRHDIWLIEVFHLVSGKNTLSAHRNEPYRFFTHIDLFKEHIQYIQSKKIPVLTQKEVIQSKSFPQ